MEVTCPSGLRGEIRKCKVREIALFSDVKLLKQGRVSTEVVKSCWVKTLDPGPYPNVEVGSAFLPWDSMLHADRDYVFKQIRIATFGPEFEWESQCPNCNHRFITEVNLNELKVTPLPETSREHISQDVPFGCVVAGTKVRFRLLRASDDKRILDLTQKHNIPLVTAALMCRIVYVEGIDADEPDMLREWVEELDVEVSNELEERMDRQEALLRTRFDSECPRCNQEWTGTVPLIQSFARNGGKKPKKEFTQKSGDSSNKSSTSSGSPQLSLEDPT